MQTTFENVYIRFVLQCIQATAH